MAIKIRSAVKYRARILQPGMVCCWSLAGIAEFERKSIKARTGDGRARAKVRGVKFGHPPKLSAYQRPS
jgi:DNA invertase Pin-like site-specific DNA recombinase